MLQELLTGITTAMPVMCHIRKQRELHPAWLWGVAESASLSIATTAIFFINSGVHVYVYIRC